MIGVQLLPTATEQRDEWEDEYCEYTFILFLRCCLHIFCILFSLLIIADVRYDAKNKQGYWEIMQFIIMNNKRYYNNLILIMHMWNKTLKLVLSMFFLEGILISGRLTNRTLNRELWIYCKRTFLRYKKPALKNNHENHNLQLKCSI